MPTETAKRKQTMQVLNQLKMPTRRRNDWSGEELPPEEEESQDDFEKQRAARTEQSMVNTMPEGALKGTYDAVADVAAGPTGMSKLGAANSGMVPYSPAEFERRSSFGAAAGVTGEEPVRTGVEALDQPLARSKSGRKKKKED